MKANGISNSLLFSITLWLVVATAMVPRAGAEIIFDTGNSQYHGVNIAADHHGSMVTGQATIRGQDIDVYFLNGIGPDGTTPITLHGQNGEAFVENSYDATNSPHQGFSSITIEPQDGYAFTAGDFKLDELDNMPVGMVTFLGMDQFNNPTSNTFPLDLKGQNAFNFTTTAGDWVTSIVITVPTTSLLQDIKQVSVDMAAVPEPSAFVLLGMAVIGMVVYGRHAKTR